MRREPAPRTRPPASSYAHQFASTLLDPQQPTPALLTGPHGKAAARRYDVYRNNVTVSLIDALAAVYPCVLRITGEDFFRAMARFHIRETPPSSPLLFDYGRDFPAFIERYAYAQPMPWLADTARIERAWLDAYHAADAPPLAAEALAAVPPQRLAGLRFVAHPATRILRSRYSAVTIFAAHRDPAPIGTIDASDSGRRADHPPGWRRHGPPSAAGRGRIAASADRRNAAGRSRCGGAQCCAILRHRRRHRRHDRGGRLHRPQSRRP